MGEISPVLIVGLIAAGLLLGAVIGFGLRHIMAARRMTAEKATIEQMKAAAEAHARQIEVQAKDAALKMRDGAEEEIRRRRTDLASEEERLQRRRTEVDRRMERQEQREQMLNKRQSALDRRAAELEKVHADRLMELQRVAGMSVEEARGILLAEVEKESRADMARTIRQIEDEARQEGERRARELVADAIQRVASEHVSEVAVSVVPLPSEEMKGRIIGRNGRNIRAFEQAAGVDVIVDDTPEAVTISSDRKSVV
jgi:ribonuclease Y